MWTEKPSNLQSFKMILISMLGGTSSLGEHGWDSIKKLQYLLRLLISGKIGVVSLEVNL